MKMRIAAIAMGSLLLLSGCSPAKSKMAVQIDKAPSVVYAWVTEPEKCAKWIGNIKEFKALTEGGTKVGAKARQVMVMPEGTYEMTSEVLEFEPNKLVKVRITMGDGGEGIDGTVTYSLEDLEGRTKLTYDSEMRMSHWMANLMMPLWYPDAEKKMSEDLARLKSLAEKG